MGFWSRRREQSRQNEQWEQINGKAIRYVARRTTDGNGNPIEVVLGKGGAINTADGRVVLICNGAEVFRCSMEEASCGELMSLNGVVIQGINAVTGEPDTVVAYYTA